MRSDGIRFLATSLFLNSRTSSCGPRSSTLGCIEGLDELRWGEGCGGGGDDIINVLGGEMVFRIKAGASLG